MADRFSTLRQYEFHLPNWDAALLGSLMRATMLALMLAGALWALYGVFGKLLRAAPGEEPTAGGSCREAAGPSCSRRASSPGARDTGPGEPPGWHPGPLSGGSSSWN